MTRVLARRLRSRKRRAAFGARLTGQVRLRYGGGIRHYERSSIAIDQCEDCPGMFRLEAGELERLIDAEGGR